MIRILKPICAVLALLLCCGCTSIAAKEASMLHISQNELTVFSLEESGTVRRAVIEFQRANPAVTVHYQIGADSPLPREETLRALRNELQKGRGPDVLILDGIEASVYEGCLADPGAPDPQCFPNIMQTGVKNGKRYAIPMRFLPPVNVTVEGERYSAAGIPDGTEALKALCFRAWAPSVNNAPEKPIQRNLTITLTGRLQPTLFAAVTAKRQKLGCTFLEGMMTGFVQKGDFGEGFPVRMDTFEKIMRETRYYDGINVVTDLKALCLTQEAAGPLASGTIEKMNGNR